MSDYLLLNPTREVAVTNKFRPDKPNEDGHSGVDLGWLARTGNKNQPIYACEDGVVVDVYNNTYRGYGIHLQHKKGNKHYWTGYIHLLELPKFKKGDKVKRGQHIGNMGNTGIGSGEHLHLYLTKLTTKPYNWNTFRSLVIDPLPHLYCDTNLKYEFAKDYTPKWYDFAYPKPVKRDETKHQVRINSDTRNLRKAASINADDYYEYCKRGIHNIYEVVKEGKYKWGKIKDGFWVAIMQGDDEYLPMNLAEELKAANKKILDLTKQKDDAEAKLKKIKDVLEL